MYAPMYQTPGLAAFGEDQTSSNLALLAITAAGAVAGVAGAFLQKYATGRPPSGGGYAAAGAVGAVAAPIAAIVHMFSGPCGDAFWGAVFDTKGRPPTPWYCTDAALYVSFAAVGMGAGALAAQTGLKRR